MTDDYKIIPQESFKSSVLIDIDDYQRVKIWLLWSMHPDHKITLRGIYFSESAAEDRKQYIIATENSEIKPIIEPTIGNHLFGEGFGSSISKRIGGIGNESIIAHYRNLGKGG